MLRTVGLYKHLVFGAVLVAFTMTLGYTVVSAQGSTANNTNTFAQERTEWQAEFRELMDTCRETLMATESTAGEGTQRVGCLQQLTPLIEEYQAKLVAYVQSLQALHKEKMEARRAELKANMEAKRAEFEARREARFTEFCERYKQSSSVPAGFSSAFEVAGDKDKLIELRCDKVTGDVAVDVGDGEQTTYVYEKGYVYDKAKKKWEEMNLNGENKAGSWFVGDAFADVDLEDDATSPDQSTWVLGYTCSKESGSWKCGCKDAACTQPGWQIQQVQRTSNSSATSE